MSEPSAFEKAWEADPATKGATPMHRICALAFWSACAREAAKRIREAKQPWKAGGPPYVDAVRIVESLLEEGE